MSKLRVHIGHHFFGTGNLGDDLMLAGFLEAARSAFLENVTLTCCIMEGAASLQLRFPDIEWLPYDEATRAEAIARCDVWLGLGDTPFQIVLGTWFLDHLSEEATTCRRHGKPMFYLGVGVNEDEIVDEPRLRVLIGQAEKIWTRDKESAAILRRLAEPGKVSVGADLAHVALAAMPFRPPEANTLGLLLNFENPNQYRIEQIAALMETSRASHVAWLTQEIRPLPGSESVLHAQLTPAARARAVPRVPDYAGAQTPADLLLDWGVPTLLFTSRYHGALIGAWMGCRTVVFARSTKVAAGARQLGLPLVSALGETEGILQLLEETQPTPRLLLKASAELAGSACDAFFALAVARSRSRPRKAAARLASVQELESTPYRRFMERMNAFAAGGDLRQFTKWWKVWE